MGRPFLAGDSNERRTARWYTTPARRRASRILRSRALGAGRGWVPCFRGPRRPRSRTAEKGRESMPPRRCPTRAQRWAGVRLVERVAAEEDFRRPAVGVRDNVNALAALDVLVQVQVVFDHGPRRPVGAEQLDQLLAGHRANRAKVRPAG